tara:strand:- start:3168 stop:4151 length:984 start_codon:yes stop_codon:yes gene_type:complete
LFNTLIKSKFKVLNIFRKKAKKNSIYIYGKPGGGKTFLVNFFYLFIKSYKFRKEFLRVHFQEFMVMVHEEINLKRKKKSNNPLDEVASDISKKFSLIIFDELEILDIADAMIVSKLFYQLFDKGVIFIITSNYYPEELYKNGLQRSQFLPFINLINERMQILELNNKEDLRFIGIIKTSKKFIHPLDSCTKKIFYKLFRKLNISQNPKEKKIISLGREIKFKETIIDSVFVDFNFICSYKFSPNDYIKVAETFKIIFIDNIPLLGRNRLNEIRRFIILIDILYEKKNSIYIRCERKLLQMFDVKKIQIPSQRTVSRISEMTSREWNN